MKGVDLKMLAINYTTMRSNLREYCDKVVNDCEAVIVTRKNEKNVVLISLDEYNNMRENAFIMGNKRYYDRLLKSKAQIENGEFIEKSTDEIEALSDE